jgi:cellobiose phosphorylase
VKFSALTLRNRSDVVRRLSVTGYLDWVLGDERPKTLMHIVTELDADTGAVFARNVYHTDFAGRTAFFDVDGDEPSVCGGRGDFFGEGGMRAAPAALAEPRLSGPTPPGAPGVRENGGQYTHAAVWAGLAFAKLGDAERAWELFALLAPIHHGAHAAGIATYKIEPYVVAGDVLRLAPARRSGRLVLVHRFGGLDVPVARRILAGPRAAREPTPGAPAPTDGVAGVRELPLRRFEHRDRVP